MLRKPTIIDFQDYDYANRHIECIPRSLQFPTGVDQITQLINMNRILIPHRDTICNPLLEICIDALIVDVRSCSSVSLTKSNSTPSLAFGSRVKSSDIRTRKIPTKLPKLVVRFDLSLTFRNLYRKKTCLLKYYNQSLHYRLKNLKWM